MSFAPSELVFEQEVWGPPDVLKEWWEAGKKLVKV